MRIEELLPKEQKQQLRKFSTPKKKKKQEKVNWHELMDQNKRGLRRGKGGAWR